MKSTLINLPRGSGDAERGREALIRARRHAPFLLAASERHPHIAALMTAGSIDAGVALAQVEPDDGAPLGTRLRRRRDRLALALALGDLAGSLSLETVIETLSDFADEALDRAIIAALSERVPGAEPRGFAVIALGKHGSRELNYSSDIDPILIYDPAILPRRAREEPGEAAVRVARRVVDLLQTRDRDGYVFRVDLRLRPASEVTPIALPVDAAIAHYESSALPWERAAFIRARAAAGDRALGARFLAAIEPFVWRRSIDFGAVAELRALTQRIRGSGNGVPLGPGFDVKRGRGGIREVEFFAQVHQLVHGGRDPALRSGTTLTALSALTYAGWIDAEAAAGFAAAYRVLRTIEHRLQMVDDRQTHELPVDAGVLDQVARLHALDDGPALIALLAPHVGFVGARYDGLDHDSARAVPQAPDALAEVFTRAGFADAVKAARRVEEWRSGSVRALRTAAALGALDAVLGDLIEAFGQAPDPDATLTQFDRMLGRLSSAINLFRLLEAQPALRGLLIDILAHAPALAEALSARPALLDRLIDATAFDPLPPFPALVGELAGGLGLDTEAVLDRVRHVVGEHRFALGTQLVEGRRDALAVATDYAHLADAAVAVVTARVVADFALAHGSVSASELVVLALGRLGGQALTHASDLDLVYLFTGDHAAQSDGDKPLGATLYYNRLGQRLSAGLSAPTSVGALYDVDTRLRPSGAKGPLVVSVDAFARYQHEAAWTWEHMALTRARPVFGSPWARAEVMRIVDDVLRRPRPRAALAAEVVAMRADIAAHKPAKGVLDVKLAPGGLVDLEFIVHFHQLATGVGLVPSLGPAIAVLAEGGLVDATLGDAHDRLTRAIVGVRLMAPDLMPPPLASRALLARAGGADDWDNLLAGIADAQQVVRAHWAVLPAAAGES